MGKKFDKVKNYVKENKEEIILGAALGVAFGVGLVAGRYLDMSKEERNLIDNLREFGCRGKSITGDKSIFSDFNHIQKDTNHVDIFANGVNTTIANIGESVREYYESNNVNLDTPCVGLAVFLKK